MAGKLTTILARKEAEVYCTHGLHQEALTLYHRVLKTSPNIDQSFKNTIESQISDIEAILQVGHPDENACISARDILQLKEGWGPEPTFADLLVCAQAFYRIGHFRSALSEMVKLIAQQRTTKGVTGLFADCIAGMCPPQKAVTTVQRLTRSIFKKPEIRLAFLLRLAEKMVKAKHRHHALALYNHLKSNPLVKTKAHQRLSAVAVQIKALEGNRSSK